MSNLIDKDKVKIYVMIILLAIAFAFGVMRINDSEKSISLADHGTGVELLCETSGGCPGSGGG